MEADKYVHFQDSKVYHEIGARIGSSSWTMCGIVTHYCDPFRPTPHPKKPLCKRCAKAKKRENAQKS